MMSSSPVALSTTRLCRPTSTNSGCGTGYCLLSEVRMAIGARPTNCCRISSRFMTHTCLGSGVWSSRLVLSEVRPGESLKELAEPCELVDRWNRVGSPERIKL